jgi:methionyl-tRNA synthetase
MSPAARQILVTSALPYANGRIHLGHMVEHIQSDIWVRAMRMAGHTVHFVCADDAHGTSIMLRAEREGITPQELIAREWSEHTADLHDFGVAYDHYSTTDSDANRELTTRIWEALKAAGHVEARPVRQLYDPVREMFLPDRFIKGECPNCHSKDQYGDSCEVCGKTYAPTDLIEPYSVVSGATPVERESRHLFVRLADFEPMLAAWLEERRAAGALQGEVVNKLKEWFADGLRSWDVSRDAPYFGFEIPDEPGKYFYVWVDAPIGYLSTFRELCESGRKPGLDATDFARFTDPAQAAGTELVHFIGKDIIYFHTLFWPAMLHGAGLRTPTAVHVHGFLTVDGAKMSKSRGTFIEARTYLDRLEPDYLRYYLATLLGPGLADMDLDLKAFEERVNSHLVGKWVNLASRTAGFISKLYDGRLAGELPAAERERYATAERKLAACATLYEARDYAAAIRLLVEVADEANAWIAERAPWKLAKDEARRADLHVASTLAINYFRLLAIYLSPVVPAIADRARAFLGDDWRRFDAAATPLLGVGINEFAPLAQRIETTRITDMIEASKESLQPAGATAPANAAPPSPPGPQPSALGPQITIDDFAKLDLRVGTVLECSFIDGADKLLRFRLDVGELGERQVFSGIRAAYPEPEKLVGRHVVLIANLAPRKMRFGVSEGMILSAGNGGEDLFLLDVDAGAMAGATVR